MKKSLQAALLSALVFPGAGQLWLKRYLRGALFVLAASASLAVIAIKAVHQALAILEKAELEGGALDMAAIINSASSASAINGQETRVAVIAAIAVWLLAVVDGYLLGRKRELAEQANGRTEGVAGRDREKATRAERSEGIDTKKGRE